MRGFRLSLLLAHQPPWHHRWHHELPFFGVALRSELLPPITLLGIWLEATIHLCDHRHVSVAELPGYQLERGAGARHPYRPVVPCVVQAVALEAERFESFTVMLVGVP